jgi:hypothetical protein
LPFKIYNNVALSGLGILHLLPGYNSFALSGLFLNGVFLGGYNNAAPSGLGIVLLFKIYNSAALSGLFGILEPLHCNDFVFQGFLERDIFRWV